MTAQALAHVLAPMQLLALMFVFIALSSWYGLARVIVGAVVLVFLLGTWNHSDAATVQFNGRTCALPPGVNVLTQPLQLPICGGYFVCGPTSTAYLASATLVVVADCVNDRVFSAGFDSAAVVATATHAKGAWLSLNQNSSSAAGPRSGRASRWQP